MAAKLYGKCPTCDGWYQLTKKSRLRRHLGELSAGGRCPSGATIPDKIRIGKP